MKIDAETGWFKGLGDIVVFAWIGAGLKSKNIDFSFYCTGWRAELFAAFNMPTTVDKTNAVTLHEGYETCVKEKSPLNYLEWITAKLEEVAGNTFPKPIRPNVFIPPVDREYGRKAGKDAVLVFPHCVWEPRTWPKNYFIALCDSLKRAGHRVIVITQERDGAFLGWPCMYQKSLTFVAAAMQSCKMVIGNDSGPAHLAGTLGKKTIAIHGPTQGKRIYGYLPEVISYEKTSLGCSGCHCLPPFPRAQSCTFGCQELYRTFPEEVAEFALNHLQPQMKAA